MRSMILRAKSLKTQSMHENDRRERSALVTMLLSAILSKLTGLDISLDTARHYEHLLKTIHKHAPTLRRAFLRYQRICNSHQLYECFARMSKCKILACVVTAIIQHERLANHPMLKRAHL